MLLINFKKLLTLSVILSLSFHSLTQNNATELFKKYVTAYKANDYSTLNALVKEHKTEFAEIFYAGISEVNQQLSYSNTDNDLNNNATFLIILATIANSFYEVYPSENFLYSFLAPFKSNLPPSINLKVNSDRSFSVFLFETAAKSLDKSNIYTIKEELASIDKIFNSSEGRVERLIKMYREKLDKEQKEKLERKERELKRKQDSLKQIAIQLAFEKSTSDIASYQKSKNAKALIELLNSSNESRIQIAALKALGSLKDTSSAEKIYKFISNEILQSYVINNLVELGSRKAILLLIKSEPFSKIPQLILDALNKLKPRSLEILHAKLSNPENMFDLQNTSRLLMHLEIESNNFSSVEKVYLYIAKPSFSGFFTLSPFHWLSALKETNHPQIHDRIFRYFFSFWVVLPFSIVLIVLLYFFRHYMFTKTRIKISAGIQKQISESELLAQVRNKPSHPGFLSFHKEASISRQKNSFLANTSEGVPFVSWGKNIFRKTVSLRLFTYISNSRDQIALLSAGQNLKKGKYLLNTPTGKFIKIKVV